MKNIFSVLALALCFTAVAKADIAPEYNLVCTSTYRVTGDEELTVKGPTLTAPLVAGNASGSKDQTKRGVGYSASYTGQTGKVTISITTDRGIAKATALISPEMESELSSTLDASTTLNVTCILAKK